MHLEKVTSTEETQMDGRDLMCPICMTIAEDPHITSCCHRVFCSKDASSRKYDNGCPLCRAENYSFQQSDKHKAMLDKLTMKCTCSERILQHEHQYHMERCLDVKFTCPHSACKERNDRTEYNSEQLVNHLARAHCDEVPILGSTYINKKSLEPYKKVSAKYDDLVSTLYSELYPKMIDIKIKSSSHIQEKSPIFKCPSGHPLIDADRTKRKRKDGSAYSSSGFSCDICHRSFSNGHSWHCSCTQSGYDKCVGCVVFELYDISNDALQIASQDNEEQQRRYRRQTIRNTVRLPRGLFRLLTGNMDEDEDDDDDDDTDDIVLRHATSFINQHSTFEGTDDDEVEVNLRED
ncbi:unnamed protein product [Rotaria sp. Silwood2]|nr:unnamed protein product [Rotaria sp. Silwood2]CAF2675681.1 unnamed protein product [Rotaria sp. Silwood2]CAF3100721.1 unnamed protein product [Rotaria sp. Silwood2]CAF3936394.1 unnamed protein product [Rotaria sp. Silwood2]CAF4012809.1 unnamed protein product [Rotaria sp. Silwood2]